MIGGSKFNPANGCCAAAMPVAMPTTGLFADPPAMATGGCLGNVGGVFGCIGGSVESAIRHSQDVPRTLHEEAKFRRQQELAREWSDKVYKKIQKQIDAQLAQLRTEDITTRRRQLMEDYIRVSNEKKFGLYRDIIIESEYDPNLAHKTLLKYEMDDRQDPLKQELVGRNPLKPLPKSKGRVTLDPGIWDRLHATPYGRFDRVVAPEPVLDPSKMSRVNFEHYNVKVGRDVLDREFPRGKRTDCGGRDMRTSIIFKEMDPVQPFAGFPPEYM